MTAKYKIGIVEDYQILREGLRALLGTESEFEIVFEAGDGRDAIRSVEEHEPHLVLMDLSMPRMNGLEAIKEIKKTSPKTRVMALTVHKSEEYIFATLQAGAEGYVLKDTTHAELVMAIKHVLAGQRYLSPSISEKVIEGYLEEKRTGQIKTSWDTLTKREREILKLIAEGYKNKEIAEFLYVSLKTVEKHRTNLMRKLDLHNVASLTAFAVDKGLVNK